MSKVVVDLEIKDAGTAQIVQRVTGHLKDMGGQAKATQSIVQGMFQGMGQAAFHALEEIPKLFVEMGHAAVEFATQAVEHLMHVVHALEGFMAKTGLSAKSAQELGIAMKIAGGDSETLAGMIGKMQKNLVAGSGAFAAMGLDVKKLKNEDPAKAFTEIAERIREIKNPTEQAAAMMAVFGKSGTEAARLIKEGVGELVEDAHHLGAVLGDEDVHAAAELGKESRRLAIAWEAVQNQFAAALISSPELRDILKQVVEVMASLSRWVHENKGAISIWVSAGLQEAVTWLKALWEWAGKAGGALKAFAETVAPGLGRAMELANARAQAEEAARLARQALAPKHSGGGGGEFDFDPKGETAAQKAQKAWQTAAIAGRKANDELTANVKDNAYQQMLGIQNLFDKRGKAQAKELDAELLAEMAHRERLLKLGEDNEKIFAEMERRKKAAQLEGLAAVGEAMQSLGGKVGFLGEMVSGFANVSLQMMSAKTNTEKFTAALQTAANIYNAGFQSKSTGKGALSGAAQGAAVGTGIMPGWGTVIGAGVGAVIGIFGAKKGQAAELKQLSAEFEDLMAQARKAGVVFDHTFNPRNAKEYKAAIDEVKKALDTNAEAQEKLHDALSRYNFTLAEQGPILAAQELDQKFGQIYQDWMLLKAAGVDHNALMRELGPSVGTYVDAAKAAGTEIPIAMKPIIDDLYTHGKLLHENGEAYTEAEYNGLSYAQTMSQMFQDLIKHVEELVAAIRGVPDKTATITVRTVREGGGAGDGDGSDMPDPNEPFHSHASGLFMPSASSDGWLKYHRGERLEITPAANSAARNSSGGGTVNNVTVNVAGDGDAQKIRDVVQRALDGRYIKVPA